MIAIMASRVLRFNLIKELYTKDPEFLPIIDNCKHSVHGTYSIQDGFLFKGNKLCEPNSFFKELLIQEARGGGLTSQFRINKTLKILQEYFYWPKMNGNVHAMIFRCSTCQREKSHFHKWFYTTLPVLTQP